MKTAISLPDDLFVLADEFAQQHDLSRSELYAMALRAYIEAHRYGGLTERINRACENLETTLPKDLADVTRQKFVATDW